MAFRDWFKKRLTPLQAALQRAMAPGAEAQREIETVRDYRLKSAADGQAVAEALEHFLERGDEAARQALDPLIGFFQNVEDDECEAFEALRSDGIPHLCRLVENALSTLPSSAALPGAEGAANMPAPGNDLALFALKILAMYGTDEGTDAVVRAAQMPFEPDSYMWSVILGAYRGEHPQCERLYAAFAEALPPGFLAIALLDAANAALIDGLEMRHPFDTEAGVRRLEQWLTDKDEEHSSYAISATAALPFLEGAERDRLAALALDHADPRVQLEAAWAAAKLGREAGVRCLARYCRDVNQSVTARRYLQELRREDAIPEEALDADFQAKAEFAQWLAHPNELGRAPDELEIVDRRELRWPPNWERRPFWLIKYRVRNSSIFVDDDVDVGLVGSTTFCLVTSKLAERPPEDGYAIHCCWEMRHAGLIRDMEVEEESDEYDAMFGQWSGGDLKEAVIVRIAEISPELNYPQRLVALATAEQAAEPGWVVLDGPRSAWYPRASMPADVPGQDQLVLDIHVGRLLLGFVEQPDRARHLAPPRPALPPQVIVDEFERLLERVRGDKNQQERGLLREGFSRYVDACHHLQGGSRAAHTALAYEKLLAVDPALQYCEVSSTAVGMNWDAYVDALIELGRSAEVPALIARFDPHWRHNLGYSKLGKAAFRAGDWSTAERYLNQGRAGVAEWERGDDMSILAEIWCKNGRSEEAKTLLQECLQRLLAGSESATGSDKKLFESWFQCHRSTYLRLFPETGAEELDEHGIPESTR